MEDEEVTVLAIAACDNEGAIGFEGNLLYSISADMRRFARITQDSVLLMGRKTFESLPKILPGRTHVIVSRRELISIEWPSTPGGPEHVEVISDIETALTAAKELAKKEGHNRVSIIGGGEIYHALIDEIDAYHLTLIRAKAAQADTFFPLDKVTTRQGAGDLVMVESEDGRQDDLPYRFVTLTKAEPVIRYVSPIGPRGFILIGDKNGWYRVRGSTISVYMATPQGACIEVQVDGQVRTLRYENHVDRDEALGQLDEIVAGGA